MLSPIRKTKIYSEKVITLPLSLLYTRCIVDNITSIILTE